MARYIVKRILYSAWILLGIIAAAAGFVLAFVGIGLWDRRLRGRAPRIRIVCRAGGEPEEDTEELS